MAKDLPEYTRQQGITPAASPQGFDTAMAEVASSTNIISQLGTQISQMASNEQARLAGLEAGKTPGRVLLPAFTESDQEFVKAYKAQEYNIAAISASKALETFSFEAKKMPSNKSLETFNQQMGEYVQNNIDILSADTVQELKPKFEAQILGVNHEIQQAVFNKNQKFMQDGLKQSITQSEKDVEQLISQGLYQEAEKVKERQKNELDSDWAAYMFAPEIRQGIKKEIDDSYLRATYRKTMTDAFKVPGLAEELLQDAAKLSPSLENLMKQEVYLATYKNHRALVRSTDEIKLAQATFDLEADQMTPVKMLTLKEEISAPAYADFEVKVARHLRKNKEDETHADYLLDNSRDAIALANLTDAQLNEGFATLLKRGAQAAGQNLTFEQEAMMAEQLEATIPSFNKKLSGGINSNNPEMAVKSARMYANLFDKNPTSVAGIDAKSKAKAELINEQIAANSTPIDAWKFASDKIDNLTPKDIAQRRELFQAYLKDNDKKSPLQQDAWVRKITGFGDKKMPPGIVTDFVAAMEREYMLSQDWGISEKNATLTIKGLYGEDHGRIMYLPPSANWPGGDNPVFLSNLAIMQLENILHDTRIAFDAPNSTATHYFKFKEGSLKEPGLTLFESRLKGVTTPGGISFRPSTRLRGVMVDSNGKEVSGEFIYNSDIYTTKDKNALPSYAFLFIPKGSNKPIEIFTKDLSAARFYFGEEERKHYQSLLETEKKRKASQRFRADELKNKIIEMREALGEEP